MISYGPMHKICLNSPGKGDLAITIGIFDGIHLGHQNILKELTAYPNNAVYTFNPHPRPNVKLVMPFSQRLQILRQLGAKTLFIATKKDHILGQSTVDFIEAVLVKEINVKTIIVGQDFRLGHNRDTTAEHFKELCNKYGIKVKIINDLEYEKDKLSSTYIRDLISKADFEKTQKLLGRPYSISGVVVKGKGFGQKIGFRTANINPHKDVILPSSGVYATTTKIGNSEYKSVCFIGEGKRPVIEAHIPGIELDLYGKRISVSFIKKLREVERFNSISELANAIRNDVKNSV